jgi:hypothetical protein
MRTPPFFLSRIAQFQNSEASRTNSPADKTSMTSHWTNDTADQFNHWWKRCLASLRSRILAPPQFLRDDYMALLDSGAAVRTVSKQRLTVVTNLMFRTFCLTAAVIVAGCATTNGSQASRAAPPAPTVSTAAAVAPGADVEARRVAADAKKLNLEVVNQNGQVRYCRSNVVTGSRFGKDRQCFTAEQVEALRGQTQQSGSQ